jgi:hypothetical protein
MLANAITAKSISSNPIAGDLRRLEADFVAVRVMVRRGTAMLAESASRVMRGQI